MAKINCDDKKNKQNSECKAGNVVGVIGMYMLLWIIGAIITFVVTAKSASHEKTLYIGTGITLIITTSFILVEKYANWPIKL